MKIRNGFVSNSSSSSFWFAFNGDTTEDLCASIRNHKGLFDLSSGWDILRRCTADDVINAINSMSGNESINDWEDPGVSHGKIYSIDYFIEIEEKAVEDEKKYLENIKEKYADGKDKWIFEWTERGIKEHEDRIAKFNAWKERGIKNSTMISFGDNHGDFMGGNLGYCMDYERDRVEIESDDLCITVRNDH